MTSSGDDANLGIDIEEMRSIIAQSRPDRPTSSEEHYLAEIARNSRLTHAAFVEAQQTAQNLQIAQNRATSEVVVELRIIRWFLFILLMLTVHALFIWGPEGWWHTPFWAF